MGVGSIISTLWLTVSPKGHRCQLAEPRLSPEIGHPPPPPPGPLMAGASLWESQKVAEGLVKRWPGWRWNWFS